MPVKLHIAGYRCLAAVFFLSLTGVSPAQTVPEMEQRLRQAASVGEKQENSYQFARLLLLSDPVQAARFADQALQLAAEMKDANKEAESAWLAADLAERAHRWPAAIALYTRVHLAASSAGSNDRALEAVEKLQSLTARQGDYKAAYQWSQMYRQLQEGKYRRQAAEQNRVVAETQANWQRRKDRETYVLGATLLLLSAVLFYFYYSRQRANRRIRGEMAEKNAMIEEKRRRSEQLLLNILPRAVAAELTVRNKVAARRYERATVMFIDFVGFTQISEGLTPEALIAELDQCFSAFDELIGRKRIEKIKTVGDAYICASGLSDRNESPAEMIAVALQIQQFLAQLREKRQAEGKPHFEARIGIHFGPVVAGVVGTKKFAYDIWGDTVNTAARLEESCAAGAINVSGAVRAAAADLFQWEYRGRIAAKNKGELEMYYVTAK